ncbi:hypothetical protein [Methanobrevibacter sp.]
MIFTLFLGISIVSASDINSDDTVSLTDNNIKTSSNNIEIDDVENNVKNDNNENEYSNPTITSTSAGNGEIIKDPTNAKTISDLNETINSGNSSIILDSNYNYSGDTDSRFIELGGIVVSRDLTIDGRGHTIDLGGKIRFLKVSDYSITLKNINIINGYTSKDGGALYIDKGNCNIANSSFTNNYADDGGPIIINNGGALYIANGNCSIVNSSFTNNYAEDGGAIRIEKGNITIINSTFNSNKVRFKGGAIYIFMGTNNITNSTFITNNADSAGAIYSQNGNSIIINSTFNSNNANNSGAIYIYYGNGSIMNSTFDANNAKISGGAIGIMSGNGSIMNSTFTTNNANNGGAIYTYNGNVSIMNSTFTKNNVTTGGGAIQIQNSTANIRNSTFINNNAEYGGAINIQYGNSSIINSVFTKNNATTGGGAINIYGNKVNITNSIFTTNNAVDGGAIQIYDGNISIKNANFTTNNATQYGSAIYYDSGILNVTTSNFTDNFGNIVYYNTNDKIYVDNATSSLSDPDLICNHTDLTVQIDNYTYESEGSIFCNVSSGNETIYGLAYVVIGNKTYTAPIMNGTGTIALSGLKAGNYTLYVIYNGTGGNTWAKSRTFANLTVYKKDVDMNVSAPNITYTEDGLVNVSFNQAVEGLTYINYDNKTYSVNISGDSAVIAVPGLIPGVYSFDVYFDSLNYNASMKTVSFTVFKKDPEMSVTVANITYGEDTVIFVNFAEKLNGTAYLIYNNINYTCNITGGKGNITIKGLNANDYNLNLIFDETILYNATSAPAVFTIFKANSTISVTAEDVDYGNVVFVNVTTSCEDGDIYLLINNKTYTGYIRNGVGIINVIGLEPGYYNTNVTYNGSINYNPYVSTVNFTVNKLNTTLIISNIDIKGSDVLISIFTTGEDSVAYVVINNQTFTGDVVNHQGLIKITDLPMGYYEVNVTYNGSIHYNPSVVLVNFNINNKTNSTINVNATDVVYGKDVILNVTTDCDDGLIFVEFNGHTYTGYIVDGEGLIIIPGLDPGFYELNVTYKGSEKYSPCVLPVNFTVEKMNTTLIISNLEVDGTNVLITVFTPGPDSVAYIIINNKTYTGNIINYTGIINITSLEQGYYELNLTYNGTKYYNSCDVPVNFTIDKSASSITVTADDVVYPGDVILNVTTDCDDGLIFVKINGQIYTGNIIEGNGIIIVPKLEPGFYELNVTYNGSNRYNPCVVPINFNVLKQNATVTTKVDIVGGDVLITVFTNGEDSVAYVIINNVTYSTNIVNLTGVINITGLEPGDYSFNLTYNGSNHYNPCVVPVNFTIGKHNSTVVVNASDVVYGKDVLINVTTDCDDGEIYVEFNGQRYSGYILDGKGSIIVPSLDPGSYELNVTYAGSDHYNPCVASVNFTVNMINSTTLTSVELKDGNVYIKVLTSGDDSVAYVIFNGTNYTCNITGGQGVIRILGLGSGYYEANVTYMGTKYYNPSVSYVDFTIGTKKDSFITVNASDVVYGKDVLINVRTDCDDSIVYVLVNGQIFEGNVIDGIGSIRVSGLDTGKYELNVTYTGSDNYNPCVASVNFTVNPQPTCIRANDVSFIINYGDTYKINFDPLFEGANIKFTINGKIISSALTDKSGIAVINLSPSQLSSIGAGSHNMIVSFAGNTNYLPFNTTVKVSINKEATKFINVKSVKKSYKSTAKSMQLTATLKDSKNKVIKSQWVYFKINNKKIYKVKTNSKGVATLTLNSAKIKACKLNRKGNYKFTVTYKTTATYKQASKNGTLKVVK